MENLSNILIPKDGVLLPHMASYSSVLPVMIDPLLEASSSEVSSHLESLQPEKTWLP
jgi:hypothetical protein